MPALVAVPVRVACVYHRSLEVEPESGLGVTDHVVPVSVQAVVAVVVNVMDAGAGLDDDPAAVGAVV